MTREGGVEVWAALGAALVTGMALVAAGHAILYKRDPRAAVAWVGFVWLVPLLGPILYWILGVNRIRRRAVGLFRDRRPQLAAPGGMELDASRADDSPEIRSLLRATARISGRPLVAGNRVDTLVDGDAAYPEMLDAIDEAGRTVAMSTYIFDRGDAGRRFVDALERAAGRGVDVRVLVDGVGARYGGRSIVGMLRRRGVRAATFLPTWLPVAVPFANLRNHRKILVVDGEIAFTGGMNVRDGHVLGARPAHPVRDLHFAVRGAIVPQLTACFAEDWAFVTGEMLDEDVWFPQTEAAGSVRARAISSGPDDDFEKLRHVLLAAVSSARRSIRIATPYFVPDASLITAIRVAVLRGVEVDVLLPGKNNLPFVQWASTALLWEVLEPGGRVHLSAPPFDHSKVFVVDDAWVLVGSANWDARSLRLNFEVNLEAVDGELARKLAGIVDDRIAAGREILLEDVDGRSLPVRLRDGVAKLFTPYL